MTQHSTMPAIRQLGDPVLRQQATAVSSPFTAETQHLISQMLHWVIDANGVGLAAPQIGLSQQILIIASRPNARYPHAPLRKPFAVINPQLIAQSDTQQQGWEGCLSVPGVRGLVPRADWVEVRYLDEDAQAHQVRFEGFIARIFQHEYDHLIGLSYLDRVKSTQDIISETYYFQQLKQGLL